MPTDIPKNNDLFHFMMTLKFSYTKNFFPSSPSGNTKYASKFLFGSFSPFAFKTPNSVHSDNFLEISIFFAEVVIRSLFIGLVVMTSLPHVRLLSHPELLK